MKHKIWAEKYRPKSIEEYVDVTGVAKTFIGKLEPTNMILHGPPGTGKSSFINVILHEFDLSDINVYTVNGSTHNRIDDIRDMGPFLMTSPIGNSFKVVIIEEAHRLTFDAQSALLMDMEQLSDVYFILTTNYPNKLIEPLRSRCPLVIEFTHLNGDIPEALLERLLFILNEEGVRMTEDDDLVNLVGHIEANSPDIRRIINSLQQSSVDGILQPVSTKSGSSQSLEDWIALLSTGTATKSDLLKAVVAVDHTNMESYLAAVYEYGLHNFDSKEKIVNLIADFLLRKDTAFPLIMMESFIYRAFGDYE